MAHLLSAVVVLSVVPARVSPVSIEEEQGALSCCDSPALNYTEDCRMHWTINETTFAYLIGGVNRCTTPCKTMEGGRMTLDSCRSVNATAVCPNGPEKVKETRIIYLPKDCPSHSRRGACGHLSSSIALVPLAIVAGLVVKKMTS